MNRWLSPRILRDACRSVARRPTNPALRRVTVAEVDVALLSLPHLERAVYLNRKRGLSYRAIARRLGIGVDDVEKIMVRAIFHLLRAFEDMRRERGQ